ncbi:MAG: helix-turn-helix domain-containing protein [Emergencia sp.]|nr:helix-turn-helix domain-containing protein [Emergencia sp.]
MIHFVRTFDHVVKHLLLSSHHTERAKVLLLKTNLSITEIALRAGFSSSGYFTNVFREKHGITPSGFRNFLNR